MTQLNQPNPNRSRKPAGGSLPGSLRNDVQFTSAGSAMYALREPASRGTHAMARAVAVASVRRMIV